MNTSNLSSPDDFITPIPFDHTTLVPFTWSLLLHPLLLFRAIGQRPNFLRMIKGTVSGLVLILVWWLVAEGIHNSALPSPFEVFDAVLPEMLSGNYIHFVKTLERLSYGLLIGILTGGTLGFILGIDHFIDSWVSPLIYIIYPVPKVIFLPIFFYFFGLGDTCKILLVALILFFQLSLSLRSSIRAVQPEYIRSIISLGATKWQVCRHVIIPSTLPTFFSALRPCIGSGIAVLFITETYATQEGLGYYIFDAIGQFDYTKAFVGVLLTAFMGISFLLIVDLLEKITIPYLPPGTLIGKTYA